MIVESIIGLERAHTKRERSSVRYNSEANRWSERRFEMSALQLVSDLDDQLPRQLIQKHGGKDRENHRGGGCYAPAGGRTAIPGARIMCWLRWFGWRGAASGGLGGRFHGLRRYPVTTAASI